MISQERVYNKLNYKLRMHGKYIIREYYMVGRQMRVHVCPKLDVESV